MEIQNTDSEDEEVEIAQPKRKTKIWTYLKTLENEKKRKSFFKKEPFWQVLKKVSNAGAEKVFYYCNKAGVRRNKCPAQLTVTKQSNSTVATLERANEHDHRGEKCKITPQLLTKIKEYVRLGLKQRAISHEIRNNPDFPNKPTKTQVSLNSIVCNFLVKGQ